MPLQHQMGPGGRYAYLIDSVRGLIVYQAKTGNLVKKFPFKDVLRRGVTFSADGRYGVVTTQEFHIGFFDTTTHQIVHQVALERRPTMAFLIEPAEKEQVGTCLVLTFVPLPPEEKPRR